MRVFGLAGDHRPARPGCDTPRYFVPGGLASGKRPEQHRPRHRSPRPPRRGRAAGRPPRGVRTPRGGADGGAPVPGAKAGPQLCASLEVVYPDQQFPPLYARTLAALERAGQRDLDRGPADRDRCPGGCGAARDPEYEGLRARPGPRARRILKNQGRRQLAGQRAIASGRGGGIGNGWRSCADTWPDQFWRWTDCRSWRTGGLRIGRGMRDRTGPCGEWRGRSDGRGTGSRSASGREAELGHVAVPGVLGRYSRVYSASKSPRSALPSRLFRVPLSSQSTR